MNDEIKVLEASLGNISSKLTYLEKSIKGLDTSSKEYKETLQRINQLEEEYADKEAYLAQIKAEVTVKTNEEVNAQKKLKQATKDTDTAQKSLKVQLKEIKGQLALMAQSGQQGTDAYIALAKRAGEIKIAMGDAGQAIGQFASETSTINNVMNVAQGATAAFGALSSSMQILGINSKSTQETLQQFAVITQLLTSLQVLQNTVMDKGSVIYRLAQSIVSKFTISKNANTAATVAQTAATEGLTVAEGHATVAAGALSTATALATGGISLLVAGIIYVITKVISWAKETNYLSKVMVGLKTQLEFLEPIIKGIATYIDICANGTKNLAKEWKFLGEIASAMIKTLSPVQNLYKSVKGLMDKLAETGSEVVEREEELKRKTEEWNAAIGEQRQQLSSSLTEVLAFSKTIKANGKATEENKKKADELNKKLGVQAFEFNKTKNSIDVNSKALKQGVNNLFAYAEAAAYTAMMQQKVNKLIALGASNIRFDKSGKLIYDSGKYLKEHQKQADEAAEGLESYSNKLVEVQKKIKTSTVETIASNKKETASTNKQTESVNKEAEAIKKLVEEKKKAIDASNKLNDANLRLIELTNEYYNLIGKKDLVKDTLQKEMDNLKSEEDLLTNARNDLMDKLGKLPKTNKEAVEEANKAIEELNSKIEDNLNKQRELGQKMLTESVRVEVDKEKTAADQKIEIKRREMEQRNLILKENFNRVAEIYKREYEEGKINFQEYEKLLEQEQSKLEYTLTNSELIFKEHQKLIIDDTIAYLKEKWPEMDLSEMETQSFNLGIEIKGDETERKEPEKPKDKDTTWDGLDSIQKAIMLTNQLTDSLGSVADAYENYINAQVKAGKMSEEQARKQFKLIKAIRIAETISNTASGIMGIWKNIWESYPAPIAPIIGGLQTGVLTATGLAQIASIKSSDISGGGSLGNSGSQTYIPQATPIIDENSDISRVAQYKDAYSTDNQQDTRVYVLESDISSTQQKVAVKEGRSHF